MSEATEQPTITCRCGRHFTARHYPHEADTEVYHCSCGGIIVFGAWPRGWQASESEPAILSHIRNAP